MLSLVFENIKNRNQLIPHFNNLNYVHYYDLDFVGHSIGQAELPNFFYLAVHF